MHGLIDDIYQAAVLPETWPRVIDAIAREVDCFGGSIISIGTGGATWTASENCQSHVEKMITGGWTGRNIRAERLVALNQIGFFSDYDLVTQEEIDTQPIYTDFLRPIGLGWVVGATLMSDQRRSFFAIDRRFEDGPVPETAKTFLNGIRPHLARAVMISDQISLERTRGILNGLELLRFPAVAVNAAGKPRLFNGQFNSLEPLIATNAVGRLAFRDRDANTLFMAALGTLDAAPRSFAVFDANLDPVAVHVVPLRQSGRDLFSDVEAIVAFIPLASPGLPFRSLVQNLYEFTEAEARTAELLLDGLPVHDIARKLCVGVETTRTHLKRLMKKCGCSRQADLVSKFSVFQRNGPSISRRDDSDR